VDRALFRQGGAREPGLMLSTRMHERVYDLPVVIEGAARVLAARPHGRLVLAGDGSLRPALERLALASLPRDRFQFVGRLSAPELASWLGRAEVYVSASRSDSTSQSLLEAMATGALPVVSDIEGNREWVAEAGVATGSEAEAEAREGAHARGAAWLFETGDTASLAAAIARALADPGRAAAVRERNAAVIAARGEWHANLARIEACFEALAAGRPLPPEEPS
jgi:glycosyltransferase involved in cell wall biosynthesis